MKDRDEEILREIVQKIGAGYSPQKIILFGSLASGEPDVMGRKCEHCGKHGIGITTGDGQYLLAARHSS